MATSSSYGERPPLQGFRRSFTSPARQLSFHEKAGLDRSDASAEVLYSHPNARMISFSPPTDSIKPSSTADIPHDTDYPVDTIETLPWRSRTEVPSATGVMVIEKVRGSTHFLKCQTVTHALLRNSQCWCVDGESKFVLRVRKFQYYRIELPSTSEDDKAKVQELKDVLGKIIRFERTPCPFIRAFQVDLPDDAITPRRKGTWKRRESTQSNASDSETPPLRRNKPSRAWTMRNPPSAYPTNAPGFVPEPTDRFDPTAGLYRRHSMRGDARASSPAILASHDNDPEYDRYGSEQGSERDSETDRSEDDHSRHGQNDPESKHVREADTPPRPETSRGERQFTEDRTRDRSAVRQSLGDLIANIEAKTAAATAVVDPPRRSSPQIQLKPVDKKQADDQGLSSVLLHDTVRTETKRHDDEALGSEESASILPREVSTPNVEAEEVAPEAYKPNLSSGEAAPVSLNAEDMVDVDKPRSGEAGAEESTFPGEETSNLILDGHSQPPQGQLSEQTDPASADANNVDGTAEPPAAISIDDLQTESILPTPLTEHKRYAPSMEDASAHETAQAIHVLQNELQESLTKSDGSDAETLDDAIASPLVNDVEDDNESTISSADSFHTILSNVARRMTRDDLDLDPITFGDQREALLRPQHHHKRELSEMTVTTSTFDNVGVSGNGSVEQERNVVTPSLLQSAASDSSWPEPATPSSPAQEPNIRQRLKARRSFSPLPPASTIFTGTSSRSDHGNHLTKSILQKAVVKPIEAVMLLFHILARIAGGATVSDLMSGELFKRPEHRRRVSGFADQLNGEARGDSENEDDYGNLVRGRRRGSSPHAVTSRRDYDADSFLSID